MGALAGALSTGFLGGIVGGVIAGFAALWIAGWKVPTWARGLMPVLVIPLLATLISGFVMIVILGKPLVVADGEAGRRPQQHERRLGRSSSAWCSA